mmetsp:Transcript_26583/g.103469  ORF Transcript_26583/g.103469 Transcript_26583/m.103469 type:complete len:240 (-) Transcript_26583:321-1040(-)
MFRASRTLLQDSLSVQGKLLQLPAEQRLFEETMLRGRENVNLIRQLIRNRVHMGHRAFVSNRKMFQYIYGERNGMHVINLDKTVILMRRGMALIREMVANNCTVMWCAPNKEEIFRVVSPMAQQANAYLLRGKFVPGTLTDPIESRQAVRYGYKLPGCLFVMNTKDNARAVHEAALLSIPVVGIVDTDVNPDPVTYPIPGNDESPQAINLYANFAMQAMLEGKALRESRMGGGRARPSR